MLGRKYVGVCVSRVILWAEHRDYGLDSRYSKSGKALGNTVYIVFFPISGGLLFPRYRTGLDIDQQQHSWLCVHF